MNLRIGKFSKLAFPACVAPPSWAPRVSRSPAWRNGTKASYLSDFATGPSQRLEAKPGPDGGWPKHQPAAAAAAAPPAAATAAGGRGRKRVAPPMEEGEEERPAATVQAARGGTLPVRLPAAAVAAAAAAEEGGASRSGVILRSGTPTEQIGGRSPARISEGHIGEHFSKCC